jgi:uncharacterized protein (DUF2141 family)
MAPGVIRDMAATIRVSEDAAAGGLGQGGSSLIHALEFPMKTLPLVLGLVLGVSTLAPGARAQDTASLDVTFAGLKITTGAVMFTLVNSEDAYNDKAPPVAGVMLPATAASVTRTFTGLAPGRYAIKAFHDVNGDGKMNANPFGIPTEPFAFSNNAPGAMGPAKWTAASFEVKAGANTHAITID